MQNSLATRTFDRAAAAMQREAMACLPEIVRLMRTLSSRSSDVSVPELADIVQKDPVILAKVLAAANTLGYNPGRVPVTTVAQAIHVIGYERIRSLAMSLLLVEQTSRGRSADEQREVAAHALTAGCIAQAVAESRTLLNPEEAFVCASLRNFGRIVMVTCMLDDYRAAQQLADGRSDDEAFLRVFGLTPLDLGRRLLEASDLPEDILATLRAVTPDALAALQPNPSDQLLALTDFAAQLAEITLKSDLDAAAFAHASETLASRYHELLPHLADETLALVESASQQLNHFAHTLRIKSLPPRLLARLRNRAAAIDPAGTVESKSSNTAREAARPTLDSRPPAERPPAPPTGTRLLPLESPAPTPSDTFVWPTEIDRLAALVRSPDLSATTLFDCALDSLRRGLGAAECLLFDRSPSNDFVLACGFGPGFRALREKPLLRSDERTVFGICLTRGENVLIHRAADPKTAPYLPAWLPLPSVLGAFVLFPIVHDSRSHGLVLVGWTTPRQIAISPDEARAVRQLLALTVTPARARAAA